jgi:hypothetical protein
MKCVTCKKEYVRKKLDHNSTHCSKKCSDKDKWRRYYERNPSFHKTRKTLAVQESKDFVDGFKTKCSRCGIEDKRVLDFHHLRDKVQSVGSLRVGGYSKERIIAEIEKCILLCANCHRILHWEERKDSE